MAKGREVYLLRANSVTVLNKRTQGHGQALIMVAQPTATEWGPKSEERESERETGRERGRNREGKRERETEGKRKK